jgi:cytidyltransferase-like protein
MGKFLSFIVEKEQIKKEVAKIKDEPGSKKVAICVGRFQPWTLGHYKMIEEAKELDLPVHVFVVTGKNKSREYMMKNPFTPELRKQIIEKSVDEGDITGVDFISPANLLEIIRILRDKDMEPVAFLMGSDREDMLWNQYETYKDKIPKLKMKKISIKRNKKNNISGTDVREALLKDQKEKFISMTRNLGDLYNKLRDVVLKVDNYIQK